MDITDPIKYKAATAVFSLANKTHSSGYHGTLNREPKGRGWVQCLGAASGAMCKLVKINEAVEYYKIAYEIYPDIVALNQIALGYEMLGEKSQAIEYFILMKEQAEKENNEAYLQAAELGINRCA